VKIQFTRYQIATAIAVLFHCIGLVGILYFNKDFFVQSTVFNLLLSFVLLLWTQNNRNGYFFLFLISAYCLGMAAEMVGVNTAALFGEYHYGKVLGYQVAHVPLVIGINWFVIIYCCGISVHTLMMKAIARIATDTGKKPATLKALSVINDGAVLAVFFDWVMEPVAIKLGYWKWGVPGEVPIYNYICWFMVSVLMLAIFHFCKFDKQNKFAVNLLLIQLMFFLLLRTLL
jgi:putative membrane protein